MTEIIQADITTLEVACSIAFPSISTGAYGYPKEAGRAHRPGGIGEHKDKFERIITCCFSTADRDLYQKTADEMRQPGKTSVLSASF